MSERHASGDDGDLVERCGILGEVSHDGVTCLMVCGQEVDLIIRNLILLGWSCEQSNRTLHYMKTIILPKKDVLVTVKDAVPACKSADSCCSL